MKIYDIMIPLQKVTKKERKNMAEFFGFGGYAREPEGFMSWQHLVFVTSLLAIMALLAVFLGKKYRNGTEKEKNKALIAAAIAIDGVELFKIVMMCIRAKDPWDWLYNLPLFLCSVQLITIPLAAFSKGRVKEAALDFVSIFGILGAVMGTDGAGQNYAAYPVLSLDNVASGITHCISGFASLYILICGMASMKKKNIFITFTILIGVCILAYIANIIVDYNYMFLVSGDGTPYDILYNLVGGHKVLYPLSVVALFLVYILGYYWIYYLVAHRKKKIAA